MSTYNWSIRVDRFSPSIFYLEWEEIWMFQLINSYQNFRQVVKLQTVIL